MYSFQKPVLSEVIGCLISLHPVSRIKTESKPTTSNILLFNQNFLLTIKIVKPLYVLFFLRFSKVFYHLRKGIVFNMMQIFRQIPSHLCPYYHFFKTFPTFRTWFRLFFTSKKSMSAAGFLAIMT